MIIPHIRLAVKREMSLRSVSEITEVETTTRVESHK